MTLPAWAQTYRPVVGVPAAIACACLAYLAFSVDATGARLAAAVCAIAAALAYAIAWRGVARAAPLPEVVPRLGRYALLIVTSLVVFCGSLIGIAVVLGWLLSGRTQPLDLDWMYVGVGLLTAVLVVLVTWWARSYVRVVRAAKPAWALNLVVGVVVVAAALGWLTAREVPGELDREGREQARQAGAGLYDLLLVVDPGDPAGRDLILAARRELARGERLFAAASAGGAHNIAYGLALMQRPRGSRPLWRLVEPPTTDYDELTDSLARLSLERVPPSPGSYGRVLADTLEARRMRWRPGAQRGIAFVLARLPTLAQLNQGTGATAATDAIAARADPADACTKFLAARQTGQPPGEADTAVPWGDALAAHCLRLRAYREWERRKRLASDPAPQPVAVHAVTGERRATRATLWWTWARALDGRFHRPPLEQVEGGRPSVDAERLLRETRDVHLGLPVGDLVDIVEWFRPHLHFDSDEEFFPVDVDWVLSHSPGTEQHEVCDHEPFEDNCDPVRSAGSLVGTLDEYIDFAGGVRLGRDLVGPEDAPGRMYVHVREEGGRLYLGYWWYFRYNVSPWRSDVNCLPGFTFRALSCHDHEGDWEGVTVALKIENRQVLPAPYRLDNLVPESVSYEAHGHPIRWPWQNVELAADPGSYATHPVVYVAAGSHASYPAPCKDDECTQTLALTGLGEGGFDGDEHWAFNSARDCARAGPCLWPLPATRDGHLGVLWAAFPGRWGNANCTLLAKVCAQTDGPRSPSLQNRFKEPMGGRNGRLGDLDARRKADGQLTPRDDRRWPPTPWPPVEGSSSPATPKLPAS